MDLLAEAGKWILWTAQAYKNVPSIGSASEYLKAMEVPDVRWAKNVLIAALVTLFVVGATVQAWNIAKWLIYVSKHIAAAALGVGVFSFVLMITNQILETEVPNSVG